MTDRPTAAMLYAAGFGTRMGVLTKDQPKPLVEVAGKPLMEHALALIEDAGIACKVVNAHYKAQMVVDYFTDRDVAVSVEEPDILDTGGGLRHALPLLGDGPVATLNTDAIWTGPNPIRTLMNAWDPDRMDGLLILVPLANAAGHAGKGDFVADTAGRLTRGKGAYIYGGATIMKTEGLHEISEAVFSNNLYWDRMIAQGRLFGAVHDGGWCDVGRPEGIPLAEELLGQKA
ncbi:nucleotidyltransferase family protein [Qingshengfaniella alkalisoli]|uniref:Nucleotidyltransferase family protein n=1 Tax=Qingshengfaniella alkalisoli TaxID=2599296 RepID=A0A5B8I8B4_9RHOB|nr:nucleotidyltransferase family protein [Qingshengfaniella alkalisoli]QDY69969.1 nucleotidyltransferase family protein [Qingshengfaniella alkalisoli]